MLSHIIGFIYWIAALCVYLWIILSQWSSYLCDSRCVDSSSLETNYDFVIVGAGTAGSIVAHRLAEDPNVSVLLIDAGRISSSWLFDVPILSPLLQLSSLDWQFHTTEQSNACFGLKGHTSQWPRGKVIGGTSRLNYMMYVRGHEHDFELWSEDGNPGWDFHEDILQYFKKSEKQCGRYKWDHLHHSTYGDMIVSDVQYTTVLADAFIEAGLELGFPARDINSNHQTGFVKTQVHTHEGQRWSVDHGYLQDDERSNLKILCDTLVDKVLFKHGYEAYGIEGLHFNEKFSVEAKRAVILSAGTVGSSSILMRSGIGPSDHLNELEIPVLLDLPVGKNLQDHVTTGMDLILLNQSLSLGFRDIASVSSLWQYLNYGEGPWTSNGCEAFAVIHSNLSDPGTDQPDLQIMALPMGLSSDYGSHMKEAIGLKQNVWDEYFASLMGKNVASIMPVLLHPKSKGEILLQSKDAKYPPNINPNYLSDEADNLVLYEGIKLVKKIINTKYMQKLGAHIYNKSFPGCEANAFDSPEYWRCYIQHLTLTSYHPIGTCKMGPLSDPSSVVDSYLQVHGTNKLFVIDASIMPNLPSGNINAAVMMIAEKGADSVKNFWYKTTKRMRLMDVFYKQSCDK